MFKKILAGMGGAIALNIIHEVIRKNFQNVPHINEVGQEALVKTIKHTPINITGKENIYATTLIGDIISNGLYYANTATKHNLASGIIAGTAAITLPKQIGLDDEPVAGNSKKMVMTVGYYIAGALITKFIYDNIK